MTNDIEPLAEPEEMIRWQLENHLTGATRLLNQLRPGAGDELRKLCATLVRIGTVNPGLAWEVPDILSSQLSKEARRRVENDPDNPETLVWHLAAGCATLCLAQLHALSLERELGIDGEDPMFPSQKK